jgi:hypothetical protein
MNDAPDADIVVFTEALHLVPEERYRYLPERNQKLVSACLF